MMNINYKFKQNNNKTAFTLAEVLITIGIIGVVTVLLIPTIKKISDKVHERARAQVEAKLANVMKVMNAKGVLAPTSSTTEFVNLLQKHLKIIKVCKKEDLKDCFASEATLNKTSGDKEKINMLELKTGPSLGQSDNTTDNVGLVLADGTTMIITYNLNCQVDQYDNELAVDKCLRAVYDINGLGTPNTINQDIGLYNASLGKVSNACIEIDEFCADVSDTTFSPIFEAPYDGIPDSDNRNSVEPNAWAGAKLACEDKGMRMPTLSELMRMSYSEELGLAKTRYYSTKEYNVYTITGISLNHYGDGRNVESNAFKNQYLRLRCVK